MNTSCPNCGGTFTPAEYNAPSCKYCGKVLPNYADAAQKVNQVKALMADTDETGMPNIFKGMVGPYGIQNPGAVPPPYGGPYAGPPVQGAPLPTAYGAAQAIPIIVERAQRRIRSAILFAVLLPMIILMVVGGIIAVVSMRSVPSPPTHSGRH